MADFRYGFFHRPNNNKIGLHLEEKNKTSQVSDHKCKPLHFDTEGRRQPITVLPGEMYVTKTETYREEFYSNSKDEYQRCHTTKYEPVKYDGRHHDKGNMHPSHARDHPTKVDKSITRVQMETSQPMKYPVSPTYRRQSPHAIAQDDINNNFNGYGDHNKKIANKPGGNAMQHTKHHNGYNSDVDENDDRDDERHKMIPNHIFGLAPLVHKLTNGIGSMEPKAKTSSGWGTLSNGPRDANSAHDMSLSEPMNDIEKAIEYFKTAVNFQFGKTSSPASDHLKKDSYTKTIDSTEAARRYKNINVPPPVQGAHVATIDSKEAARKYKGTTV